MLWLWVGLVENYKYQIPISYWALCFHGPLAVAPVAHPLEPGPASSLYRSDELPPLLRIPGLSGANSSPPALEGGPTDEVGAGAMRPTGGGGGGWNAVDEQWWTTVRPALEQGSGR